jgi:Glu-tRNA(Gln) amidotransferase subunit E-like FAD-binding protein
MATGAAAVAGHPPARGPGSIVAGPLHQLSLPLSRSRILAATGGRLWAFSIAGGRGWFSKDDEVSLRRGRALCDRIIRRFDCAGFFTTDELPRYGLSRADRAALLAAYPDCDQTRDVLVLLAYADRMLATDIRAELVAELGSSPLAG